MQREQQNLHDKLSRLTRTEVFAIARKTLSDLADTVLEARITRVFIARLQSLQGDAKSALLDSIKNTKDGLKVRTAFELPAEECAAIQQAVNEFFSADMSIKFETIENIIGGIELSSQGQVLTWTIDTYLDGLMKGIEKILLASNTSTVDTHKIKKTKTAIPVKNTSSKASTP